MASFKIKITKSKATFLRTSLLNFKLQIISLGTGTGVARQVLKTAIFLATAMKNIFSSSFYQRVFLCQIVDKKVVGLVPKYYLLAGDTSQVSIFSLHKIKMSK